MSSRPRSWAITGPEADSTASAISAEGVVVVLVDHDDRQVRILAHDQLGRLLHGDRERRHLVPETLQHLAERLQRRLVLVGEQNGQVRLVLRADGRGTHPPRPSTNTLVVCRGLSLRLRHSRARDPGAASLHVEDGLEVIEITRACRGRANNLLIARACPALNAEDRAARSREDRRLLLQYHEGGDATARDALVQRFLPLARQLARRYQRGGEPLDDLVQVASLGLLKAIDRFDPRRETAFSSFAVPTILGELKRHFRDKGWSVRVPRDLQELASV